MEKPLYAAGWRPLLRAASFSGSATVASAALSVVATKVFATMLGPAEVAVLATLQQIRQVCVTVATLNGQTSLIQGLSARNGRERRQFLRTALLLLGTAFLLVAAFVLLAPGWVAAATGLGAGRTGLIRWMALPVALSSALLFLSAVLTARGEIGRLSVVQVVSPAAMALLAYPVARMVRGGREDMLVWWLAAGVACAAVVGALTLRRQRGGDWFQTGRWWSTHAARSFLTVSGSMLASGAVASLVLLGARARILHRQGFTTAGQFDAAWAISMNHVSLVLGSLQTFCLPVLARTPDPAERSDQLTRMFTAATLATAAAVCLLAMLKPVVLTLLYSDAFLDASRYLRWTLLGDYLKVSSWVLSIPMLAAADMRAFLAADLTAYAVFAIGAALTGHIRGQAEGTCMAFVLMYAAHLAVCGVIGYRRYGFRPAPRTILAWTAGLVAVVAVSAARWNTV
jgi:PST family polysaccharide transporter